MVEHSATAQTDGAHLDQLHNRAEYRCDRLSDRPFLDQTLFLQALLQSCALLYCNLVSIVFCELHHAQLLQSDVHGLHNHQAGKDPPLNGEPKNEDDSACDVKWNVEQGKDRLDERPVKLFSSGDIILVIVVGEMNPHGRRH